jgi:hypothetical protein
MSGILFGTMVKVFYMLAANETNDDAKTFVLLNRLGSNIAQLPFSSFPSESSVGRLVRYFIDSQFLVPRPVSMSK